MRTDKFQSHIEHRAYLMVHIDTQIVGSPIFKRVLIMSDRNPTTCSGETYALLLEVTGDSFQEAYDSMKKIVNEHSTFKWVLPYMDKM